MNIKDKKISDFLFKILILKFNFSYKYRIQLFWKLLQLILICFCNRSTISKPEMNSLYLGIPFFQVLGVFGLLESLRLKIPFLMSALRWFFMSFFIFLDMAFKADFRKERLVFMNALLIFGFCLTKSWIFNGMLMFRLKIFSGNSCECSWWFLWEF